MKSVPCCCGFALAYGAGLTTMKTQWEPDFCLDYVIQGGMSKVLGVTWRNGESHSEAASNSDHNHLIVNYTVALF